MNYPDALEYLDSLANYEKEKNFQYPEALNLDRMRRLAKALGNPQNAYPCVLIAGSKGKGSVAAILSSILRMDNLRIGLYTSPHLWCVRERIQVNGLMISENRFAEYLTVLEKMLDEYEWRKDTPTYFEVLTAIAFSHFKENKVQAAVLEVGMGGLHDSTNIVEAKAAGIAPISLEHTDKLGKTVGKIAVQKCGIIKGRECVVSAPQPREAELVITQTAQDREARLLWVGRDIKFFDRGFDEDCQHFDLRTPFGNYYALTTYLLGEHQIENAAMAVGLAWGLAEKMRVKISESAVKQGILDVRWPGRLQKIGAHPRIVVDGAHNKESVRRMLTGLARHFHYSRLIVVFGAYQDKDLEGMLEELLPQADIFYATESGHERSMTAETIAEAAENLGKHAKVTKILANAMREARAQAQEDDLILVTGSLYLVGLVKKMKDEESWL